MTCQDCIHFDVCEYHITEMTPMTVNECNHFKPKSRFVELPCEVGQMVYRHNNYVWHSECCHCEHYRIGGFGDPSECGRTEHGNKHPDCIRITEEVATQHDIFCYLYTEAFGKTVFLTREEAEKALVGSSK